MHFSRILPLALLTFITAVQALPAEPIRLPSAPRPHPEAPDPEHPTTQHHGTPEAPPPADPHTDPDLTPGHHTHNHDDSPHNNHRPGSGLIHLHGNHRHDNDDPPGRGTPRGGRPTPGRHGDDDDNPSYTICSRAPGGICNGQYKEPTGADLNKLIDAFKAYDTRGLTSKSGKQRQLDELLKSYVAVKNTPEEKGVGYMGGTGKNAMLRYEGEQEIPVGPWYMGYNKGIFDPKKSPMKEIIKAGMQRKIFEATSEYYMKGQSGNLVLIHNYQSAKGLPSYFQPGGDDSLAIWNSVERNALINNPNIKALFMARYEHTDITNEQTQPALTAITGKPIDPKIPATRYFVGKGGAFEAQDDYHGEPISVPPNEIKDLDSWLPQWQKDNNNQKVYVVTSSYDHKYDPNAWLKSNPYGDLWNGGNQLNVKYYSTPYKPGKAGSSYYNGQNSVETFTIDD